MCSRVSSLICCVLDKWKTVIFKTINSRHDGHLRRLHELLRMDFLGQDQGSPPKELPQDVEKRRRHAVHLCSSRDASHPLLSGHRPGSHRPQTGHRQRREDVFESHLPGLLLRGRLQVWKSKLSVSAFLEERDYNKAVLS